MKPALITEQAINDYVRAQLREILGDCESSPLNRYAYDALLSALRRAFEAGRISERECSKGRKQ